MNPTRRVLRPYQARLITDVSRATSDALIEQPTGSGKTMQVVTLVAMHLSRRFSHAVIAAPQEQIEHGFVHRDFQSVAFPICRGVAVPAVEVPDNLIWAVRRSELGSVKRLLAYLRQSGPLDHALACTHAALNLLTPDRLPADLSGKALFIDEAHHASADGLSQIVTAWRERGGQLFFFTATPYRGDGRPVALEGMRLFRRSLAEHMADRDQNGKPFAPGLLESEIVALGKPGDATTGGQFTGDELPSNVEGMVRAICRKWIEDGKPKTIVRVPPMRGGSGRRVSRLIHALQGQGARVLDATGTATEDKRRFLAALEAEKPRDFAASQYDVMIGIQRVMEGTDWPVCSAVYCVGMPGSLNTVVQLLGRAMRPKGDDYHAAQRDRARLVFFVPCGGGSALTDLSMDHSRHALLTCCFLADHEVGQEWIVLREVRRGIDDALGPRADNPAAADAENAADEPLDLEVRAEVELAMAAAREQILSTGGEPTLGDVVQLAAKTRPDLPEVALQRVATEILASEPGATGATAREAIHQAITKRLRIDPIVKQAMAEAFAVVLNEFRAVTLKDSAVLESVGRQIHGMTGGQMREFAQRLRDAAPRPLTEEQILAWADAHLQETGEWPHRDTGPVSAAPDETWGAIDATLKSGGRGLVGGSSLAKLLSQHRGVRNPKGLPTLDEKKILECADCYYERTGSWPDNQSGAIAELPGETWARINKALREGLRGLPGGLSLVKLLEENRGVRNIRNLPDLTITGILSWIDNHLQRTEDWPDRNSGAILDAPGESWTAIDAALIHGRRGLPAGSSLAQLLKQERGCRNIRDLPRLTEAGILQWAKEHYEQTGKWPNRDSGKILSCPGENWMSIENALRLGLRGLPGGSSLARLLEVEYNVRNHMNLPGLRKSVILELADRYKGNTGHWPTAKSGAVEGCAGLTWMAVDQALRKGLRGLPKKLSLARILSQDRGKRNITNLPSLTENQILGWADDWCRKNGTYPNAQSGTIPGTNGETWKAIAMALHRGSRGLSAASTLRKLLEKHGRLKRRPKLSIALIQSWIQSHYAHFGELPNVNSGKLWNEPGENWRAINAALDVGSRGLPSGSSLTRLIKQYRSAVAPDDLVAEV